MATSKNDDEVHIDPEVLRGLSRQWDGKHQHELLTGPWTGPSSRYPEYVCRSICIVDLHRTHEGLHKSHNMSKLVDIKPDMQMVEAHENEGEKLAAAWDDITVEELDPNMFKEARMEETPCVKEKLVCHVFDHQVAERNGWKVIQTKCADINKGDQERPNYRSRLLTKEFSDGFQGGLFACTPTLESLRLLLSDLATQEHGGKKGLDFLMINNVARTFVEAPARRPTCVELPEEAQAEPQYVGTLMMSLFGTRDAAANFHAEVSEFMQTCGFEQWSYQPSMYYQRRRESEEARIRSFCAMGRTRVSQSCRGDVDWLNEDLEGRFESKTKVV